MDNVDFGKNNSIIHSNEFLTFLRLQMHLKIDISINKIDHSKMADQYVLLFDIFTYPEQQTILGAI